MSVLFLAGLASVAQAQQIYITTTGYTARPECTAAAAATPASKATPSYRFEEFSFTQSETVR